MNRLLYVLVFLILISISGCKGCSQSGLRHERMVQSSNNDQQQTSNYDNNIYEEPRNNTKEVDIGRLFNRHKSAIFLVYTSNDKDFFQGSGFFISSDGIAVSNYHIFEDTFKGNEIIVTEDGAEFYIDRVFEKSEEMDYIIFKLAGATGMNYLEIATREPTIGSDVIAIGNPVGLEHTLSKGIISGYREEKSIIQTSAEITHGSSGGALLNMQGEVVGITSGGIGEANLNFAINIQVLRPSLRKVLDR